MGWRRRSGKISLGEEEEGGREGKGKIQGKLWEGGGAGNALSP